MKIAIIGGIYGKPSCYRENFRITPETTLEEGLRRRGIEVSTFDHYSAVDCRRFDVIHVHHLSWGAIRVATDVSQSAFVFTTHMPAVYAGQHISQSEPFTSRRAMRFVMRRADSVVALSHMEHRFQEQHYPLAGAIHRVIPNGISSRQYAMQRTNSRGSSAPWQLLYVGQLNRLKRVDLLLHAISQVSFPVRIKLAYQNSEMEADLRTLASKLGIADAVHFVGFKNPDELCRLYNESDVFVLPSSGEALPSVVTEAMLSGTPIIATDVGGVREQLDGFGRVIAPNDLSQLVSAITEVLSGYDQASKEASRMSAYAQRSFSADSMVERHIDLYEELSSQKSRRRTNILLRPGQNAARFGLRLIQAQKRRHVLQSLTVPRSFR